MSQAEDDLKQMSDAAVADIKEKWLYVTKTTHFGPDVRLSEVIWMFMQPVREFVQNKYPAILIGSPKFFLRTVFTAILESGTHSKEEINEAIRELKSRGGKRSIWKDKIVAPLNTSTKRLGAIILLVGLIMLTVGFVPIWIEEHDLEYAIRGWLEVVTLDDRYSYRRYRVAAWGTYLSIIGISMSYLYDQGIGRIVQWVRSGA